MNLLNYVVSEDATIRDALIKIDSNELGMVFVIDADNRVIGVATDGDIRSSLLNNLILDDKIDNVFNRDFIWKKATDTRESILKLLDSKIKAIPILDADNCLHSVVTASQFPIRLEDHVFARSKAPVRISFAGGGSDLTHYFMGNKGAVINTTISLYCHATLIPRSDSKITIDSYDLGEKIVYDCLEDLMERSDNFGLFRSLFHLTRPDFGFDLFINSDFPSGSGLGGSSSVMVAVLGCFNEFRQDKWDDHELAEIAFQAERINMGISGGWQDQYATVFGGVNFIEFRNESNLISPLRLKSQTLLDLQENLFLFEITSGRNSGSIHDDQKTNMEDVKIQDLVNKNVNHCYDMRESLLKGNLRKFGFGLNLAWELKRQLSKQISNDYLDEIYNYAIKNGALGGKLLGAGGGGFFLFYVEALSKNHFLNAMNDKGLPQTVFCFDHDGMQSWTIRDIGI